MKSRESESPRNREGRYAAEVLDYVQEAHDVDAHEVEACGR